MKKIPYQARVRRFRSAELKERTLDISIEFATATTQCFCGCGSEVVTPISPVSWQFTFDGETLAFPIGRQLEPQVQSHMDPGRHGPVGG